MLDIIGYHYLISAYSTSRSQDSLKLEKQIRPLADINVAINMIMSKSKYKKEKFIPAFRFLTQPAITRLLIAPFSLKKRKELIKYCYERKLFPAKQLISGKVERIGNMLIRHPWLMTPAGFVYRKIFIPYIKPHIDLYTGRFVFRNK